MRRLAWVTGLIALGGCGGYVVVYLYRWEWNRALLVAIFFVAAELALATALVLHAVERAAVDRHRPPEAVALRLREAAPRRDHFAWLGVDGDRFGVFITLLVGGGVLVSAVTWALDRLASRTAGRRLEESLARRLVPIGFPAGGLVPDETEVLAGPSPFEDDPGLRLLLGTPARR